MIQQLAMTIRSSAVEQTIASLLAERAADWFTDRCSNAARADVQFLGREQRRVSTLFRFGLEIDDRRQLVLAKQYRAWRPEQQHSGRERPPRLFPPPPVDDKATLEHSALETIYGHFALGGDRRFTGVRPLAVLPGERVVVMEHSPDEGLERLLLRNHFLARGDKTPQRSDAFHNTGAWLRTFHALPCPPYVRVRHPGREDLVQNLTAATEYLTAVAGRKILLQRALKSLVDAAATALPEYLPLAWSHSDFGPRNVLVRGSGRVSVIDTLGRWRAPIYEDIGHFLAALHTMEPQVMSQGWLLTRRTIGECQRDFVEGYFGAEEPPWLALRVFEAQAVLFRWVAATAAVRGTHGVTGLAKRCRLALRTRFLARYLARIVEELAA